LLAAEHRRRQGGAGTVGHGEDQIFQRPIPGQRRHAGRRKHVTHRQVDPQVVADPLSQLVQLSEVRIAAAARMSSSGNWEKVDDGSLIG
jgi:hypothetical protein